ncbi:MAG: hypothetical protein M0T74_13495 [Desulfitobacterium hafniense]|nr:hypothetical protein [Desulfitobacterium hafniense]
MSGITRQKRILEMKKFLNFADTPLAKFDADLSKKLIEQGFDWENGEEWKYT